MREKNLEIKNVLICWTFGEGADLANGVLPRVAQRRSPV